MLIQEKISGAKFTDAQQIVIDHILQHPEDLETMTLRDLAAACFTSGATLVRLAQKLGYSGWEDFRRDFLRENAYLSSHFSSVNPNIPFSRRDLPISILHKVASLKIRAIQETEALQNQTDLRQAASMLRKARQVVILGANNLELLAREFALKLGRLQKPAFTSSGRGELEYSRLHLLPETLLIVLSYSGETKALISFARQAREHGTPVLVLTSISESSLSKLADCILPICTREKMYSKIGWYTTEASFSYLLDTLYSILFWMDYEHNLHFKMETARQVEKGRKSSSRILQEEES